MLHNFAEKEIDGNIGFSYYKISLFASILQRLYCIFITLLN